MIRSLKNKVSVLGPEYFEDGCMTVTNAQK
jgi:hypothetical protein